MSVQVNTYVIVGSKFSFPDSDDAIEMYIPYEDSAFEGIKHYNNLCALVDGMNGGYVVVGRVLAKSDEGQPLVETTCLYQVDLQKLLPKVQEDIAEQFGVMYPVGVIVLSHYR